MLSGMSAVLLLALDSLYGELALGRGDLKRSSLKCTSKHFIRTIVYVL